VATRKPHSGKLLEAAVKLEIPDPFQFAANIFDPPKWEPENRPPLEPHQIPPSGTPGKDWELWLLEAGRGAGKTEAAARYYCKYMREHPGHRGRIIAPTFGDAVEACVEGPSGVLSIDPEVKWNPSAAGGARLSWPNGSKATVIGTPQPRDVDRLRAGGNRHLDWWEEMAANPQLKEAWDQAAFGLRLGEYPHSIASTTPRNTMEYRALRDMTGTKFTHASLFDNPHNPKHWVDMMIKKYEGTRLGRQELRGELLDDIEGALWNRRMIDSAYVDTLPEMQIVVVAVDPAATSSETSDDTGIIVIGLGVDGWGYVINDLTCHMGPDGWGMRVGRAYERYQADYVIGEVNNGGEMVQYVIASMFPNIPFVPVRASRGKQTRAQPVAALYGDGKKRPSRIKHYKPAAMTELEDQLCTWVPGEGEDSPDRLDGLVWGCTELFLSEQDEDAIYEQWEPESIGADV